jgi:hypothetical protein
MIVQRPGGQLGLSKRNDGDGLQTEGAVAVGVRHSVSVNYDGYVASSAHVDGSTVGFSSIVVSNAGGPLALGGRYFTTAQQGYEGRIYCVRLYSRALTADEIAHNYAVDKERFNLP